MSVRATDLFGMSDLGSDQCFLSSMKGKRALCAGLAEEQVGGLMKEIGRRVKGDS